jgi:hypothetical protein
MFLLPVSLFQAQPWKYFDGKLFGSIYLKMQDGAKYEDQCLHKVLWKYIILDLKHLIIWL